jgi:anti-sigma B factor antagonist
MTNEQPVVVRQLPERLNAGEAQTFFCQVEKLLNATYSRIVLDFTQVRELDAAGVQMLLRCLEEVMKRNGDVKLAAVPPGPAVMLELTSVDHLFEIFDTTADAVQSFHYFPLQEESTQVPLYASHAQIDEATAGFAAD